MTSLPTILLTRKEKIMLLNVKQVKLLVKNYNKQVSSEYLHQLDYIVRDKIIKSIKNAKHFKRLKTSELL